MLHAKSIFNLSLHIYARVLINDTSAHYENLAKILTELSLKMQTHITDDETLSKVYYYTNMTSLWGFHQEYRILLIKRTVRIEVGKFF